MIDEPKNEYIEFAVEWFADDAQDAGVIDLFGENDDHTLSLGNGTAQAFVDKVLSLPWCKRFSVTEIRCVRYEMEDIDEYWRNPKRARVANVDQSIARLFPDRPQYAELHIPSRPPFETIDEVTVLFLVAMCLSPYPKESREFARIFLDLVCQFYGNDAARILQDAYDDAPVDVADPSEVYE